MSDPLATLAFARMMSSEHLANYELLECISEGAVSKVYRALRLTDDSPVIIKQLNERFASSKLITRFTREYEIARAAAGHGVIIAHDLVSHDGLYCMILEDFGGEALSKLIKQKNHDIKTVLHIGIEVTRALIRLHRLGIVHRDINPSNIVWSEPSKAVKLIDFSIAQVLSRESVGTKPLSTVEGTAAYMSPEQTGRMNRLVDRRSDLYSFGVTMFELLTGRRPFEGETALDYAFAHLAKTPIAPHLINPEIPIALSNIVLRLLKKSADDRYQSATGLLADLERCFDEITHKGTITPFDLASSDIDEQLRVPEKLYGRDNEVETLLTAFHQAELGRLALVLVEGHSGVGKTTLVRELNRHLANRNVVFVEGKFDQFDRGTPYFSFIQVFNDLLSRIFSEGTENLDRWANRINQVVGENTPVLCEILPIVERLIGRQPPEQPVALSESRNRFHRVISSFVRALASPEHPLVLFFDDLQWADSESIQLLETLATDQSCQHILFVGAYRSTEINESSALGIAISAMRRNGVNLSQIHIEPLSERSVTDYLQDALCAAPGFENLARVCYARTLGNPFYLRRFLVALHEDGLLVFNPSTRTWTWDPQKVRERPVTDTIVHLLSSRIAKLPSATQRAIEVAACIGNHFDLKTLSMLLGDSRKEVLRNLRPALAAELIHPVSDGFWFVERVDESDTDFAYQFVHDRIRQTARGLLDDKIAETTHLTLARHILQTASDGEINARLFEIVDHLNRSGNQLLNEDESPIVSRINYQAGQRALRSAAFAPALQFFEQSIKHLPTNSWQSDYPHTLSLFLDAARSAFLSGEKSKMGQLLEQIESNAQSLLDRVQGDEVKISSLVLDQRFKEAIDLALQVLSQLGVNHPPSPTDEDIGVAIKTTIATLVEHNIGRDDEPGPSFSKASDPVVIASARIQNAIMTSAYLAVPKLLPLLANDIVKKTFTHGVCKESPYGFAIIALVLTAINQIQLGYATGQLALKILDSVEDRTVRAKPMHVVSCHVKPFVEPIRDSLNNCQKVFQIGLDTGDIEYAGWALHNMSCNAFYAGVTLPELVDLIDHNLALLQQYRQLPAIACTVPYRQAIDNLLGKVEDPRTLVGAHLNEPEQIETLKSIGFRGALFIITTIGCYLRFLYRDLRGAVTFADDGGQYADGATATQHVIWWHQYRCLSVLGQLEQNDSRATETIKELSQSIDLIRLWRIASPRNSDHRLQLVEAELARVHGKVGEATERYEDAIAYAANGGFLHEEALAKELAGRFHHARGRRTIARAYLLEAHHTYEQWGAFGKANQLKNEFAEVISNLGYDTPASKRKQFAKTPHTTSDGDDALDLTTLFRAATLVSSETKPERLMAKVLNVILENVGATRGYFFSSSESGLRVEASKDSDGLDLVVAKTPLADCEWVPSSIVNYVANTGDQLVLSDARIDGRWRSDRKIPTDHATSVICTPLAHNGRSSGILYLENHLTEAAFTPARIRVLDLLSTQAAISIENARLCETLELRVKERTQALQESLGLVVESQNKLAAELKEAADYIKSLFPAKRSTPIEVDWRFLPSADLGGDAFGYHYLPNGELAVYLIDVCGHGIASALLSISILSTLSSQRLSGTSFTEPGQVLSALNRAFPSSQHGNLFFTAWYGVIDLNNRQIKYASAGHPGAILLERRPDGSTRSSELSTSGPMLGVIAETNFDVATVDILLGGRLYVFSDGVYEITYPNGRLMAYETFWEELTQAIEPLPQTLNRMVDFAHASHGKDTLDDDFCMIAINVPPPLCRLRNVRQLTGNTRKTRMTLTRKGISKRATTPSGQR